ncbi:mycofactocin-coupled SDR family oxidoreductase [Rhodococcus sp. T2V]|uniref:mycofactocin-coupled SDR family oxidoreductase n=1 Tax=Rhodococcus sp. T2V TaxID=3034164 RepID=UPI0023E1476F|nr:mycofactocin-coupled SDR family oxidoreductase [Rhodococcus sp. T2V]MDF3312222.1 mycofactocin-coupled SDR family oxidoreductase [Rhodococcus sp. T2V]
MAGRLAGKVALVTGAARGQGRAHAVRFASEGADVIAIDLAGPLPARVPYASATLEDLEETRNEVEKHGRRIITAQADVRDLAMLREKVDEAVATFGRLDAVVANAGICIPVTWDEETPDIFDATMDINVKGVWNTVMASANHLVNSGGGSIILISSYAGKKVQPFMVAYTTSKHAVTGMTRAFAAELGRHDIRVNSIHPGSVATPMADENTVAALGKAAGTHPRLGAMGRAFLNQVHAQPGEIAAVAAFLASDEAKFISSEHLGVDGGAHHF